MLARELRSAYLRFFESKGALILPSDSLVTEDPTLLFTVAGMVPFKAYFEDRATPPRRSVATSQKCLRTKDIDDIGDISHCTFFEMLGNFSFGDYFKSEAIAWADEFLFEVLRLDRSRIRVTVYHDDQEAYDLWRRHGMPPERITRLGQKTNYWPANAIVEQSQGPCGPCSEIFFDLRPDLPFDTEWDGEGDRWLEIWNNVFTQFTGRGTGDSFQLVELPKRNIDTGMGLERTAAAINDLAGPFETDLLRPVIAHLETLSGKSYGSSADAEIDIAFRRIADHVRATTFLIADGVLPDKDKHGYVLRRLMRRAIVAGIRHLGFSSTPFLDRAVPGVVANMADAYPELQDRQESILVAVQREEGQFREILADGLGRLEDSLSRDRLNGEEAFQLFATYGLPFEVTREIAAERGIEIREDEFARAREQHALDSGKGNKTTWVLTDESVKELLRTVPPTQFVGYDQVNAQAVVAGILADGVPVDQLEPGQAAEVIADATPFYAESGGQVGDAGRLGGFRVDSTRKKDGIWFHQGVSLASIRVGATVEAVVDRARRDDIRRNHTATHLLHKALRERLGTHVAQRGSLVAPDRLRFDFSHHAALTAEDLAAIENEVNQSIDDDLVVEIVETSQEAAREAGAMMLFGEKYGNVVRMVSVGGDYSRELCGGTHVARTSEIGSFRIVSEGSAASGVRRIEATTGRGARDTAVRESHWLHGASRLLAVRPEELQAALGRLIDENKALQAEVKALRSAHAGSLADQLLESAAQLGGVRALVATVDVAETAELGPLADELVGRIGTGVVVLAGAADGKVVFVAKATRDAVEAGIHCGQLVKAAAAAAGGGGGGRPDFASAGGKDPSRIADALDAVQQSLRSRLER
jgi:alanyl-tRNA synthetase